MCLSASTYGYWSGGGGDSAQPVGAGEVVTVHSQLERAGGGGDSAQLVFHCMTMSWYAVGTAATAQPEDTAVGRGMDTNLYSKD